jgi:hypothetical protein
VNPEGIHTAGPRRRGRSIEPPSPQPRDPSTQQSPYECECGCGKKLDPDAAVYYRKGRESHAFINEAHMRAFWELEDETEAKVALEVMRERDEEYHRWFGGGDDE